LYIIPPARRADSTRVAPDVTIATGRDGTKVAFTATGSGPLRGGQAAAEEA